MTRRVHLLSSTADMGFTVQQVRPGHPGSEVWVREAELDRLREAAEALAHRAATTRDRGHIGRWREIDAVFSALAALDGEDGE